MNWNPLGSWSYEPSKSIKKSILSARKSKDTFLGSIQVPGLFEIYKLSADTVWVIIAFSLEVGGILYLLHLAPRLSPAALFASIFVDILLIIWHHAGVSKLIRYKNEKTVTEDSVAQTNIDRRGKSIRIQRRVAAVLIILLAAAKAWVAFKAYKRGISPELVAFLLTYGVVAYLHIFHTGYFFFGFRAKWQYNQHAKKIGDQFESKGNVVTPRESRFKTPLDLTEIEPSDNSPHSLFKDPEVSSDTGSHNYILQTKGLLTDQQVAFIVTQQKDLSRRNAVLVECIKHQLVMLDMDPQ